jgi:hypothetical protein
MVSDESPFPLNRDMSMRLDGFSVTPRYSLNAVVLVLVVLMAVFAIRQRSNARPGPKMTRAIPSASNVARAD